MAGFLPITQIPPMQRAQPRTEEESAYPSSPLHGQSVAGHAFELKAPKGCIMIKQQYGMPHSTTHFYITKCVLYQFVDTDFGGFRFYISGEYVMRLYYNIWQDATAF